MSDLLFNRATDNYVFTGSRLRAGTGNINPGLRLSTASNETIIDLCNNGNVDISASSVFINGLKVVTTSNGATTALTGLQLTQNLDVSGAINSDGGIRIGSGVFGGTITKSSNMHEIIIDPFGIDGSNSSTQDASGSVVIMGDLIVRGNTTTIYSTNVDISDVLLTLASGSGSTSSLGHGGGIQLGNGYASMLWNDNRDRWTFNKGLDVSGGLRIHNTMTTSSNSARIHTTFSSFKIVYSESLPASIDPSGIQATGVWHDVSGWSISYYATSMYSRMKIEARIAYTSSTEADQTLSIRLMRPDESATYVPICTDLSLGSNMGVSINNVHNIIFYDRLPIPGDTLTVIYKLQLMRNCPANDTISTPFGIQASTGNFMSLEELYSPALASG
jgi:hypothetical protein